MPDIKTTEINMQPYSTVGNIVYLFSLFLVIVLVLFVTWVSFYEGFTGLVYVAIALSIFATYVFLAELYEFIDRHKKSRYVITSTGCLKRE